MTGPVNLPKPGVTNARPARETISRVVSQVSSSYKVPCVSEVLGTISRHVPVSTYFSVYSSNLSMYLHI